MNKYTRSSSRRCVLKIDLEFTKDLRESYNKSK